jgi:hypothetical protein
LRPAVSAQTFNLAIAFILPHEEEFARGYWGDERFVVVENVPGDDGGLTKYGIDEESHPDVDIANLTRDQAIAIYAKDGVSTASIRSSRSWRSRVLTCG